MRKIFLVLLTVSIPLLNTLGQTAEMTKSDKVSYEWNSKILDLGTIKHNKPETVEFKLKNNGDAAIAIVKAEGSCGCTQITYPPEPIKGGKTGILKATYNAASVGTFTKTVRVSLSDGTTETLTIKGTVAE
jgi:hypothetical protein